MKKKYKDKEADFDATIKSILTAFTTKPRGEDPTSGIVNMNRPPKRFDEIRECLFEHTYGGSRAWIKFPNGYGASIIKTSFSYGSPKAPWEVAVMDENGVCYTTPLTDDVIGHCSEADVLRVCNDIFNLPTKQ